MNQKPHIADTKPKLVTMEIGAKYSFCTCGRSENQPFCNGAHKQIEGGHFTPLSFTAEKEEARLCMCKLTGTPPYCDGSHKQL